VIELSFLDVKCRSAWDLDTWGPNVAFILSIAYQSVGFSMYQASTWLLK
jgi:hypothetical protein